MNSYSPGPATSLLRYATVLAALILFAPLQPARADELDDAFTQPTEAARPWTFWYWMNAAISREGITADLEAMREVGLGGAYLMPIKGPTDPPRIEPPVVQLTPAWWDMLRHAVNEADRLGLKLALHACDGFAVAGGPWITPELSMQKVVWSTTHVEGGKEFAAALPQPESYEGFYRDIAVLAFPSLPGTGIDSRLQVPAVTTNLPDVEAKFLSTGKSTERVRMDRPGWIQYEFAEPFTCRSITVTPDGNNFQAQRLRVEVSDDGEAWKLLVQLEPPRHGWQNGEGTVTHSIPTTTARYYRFVFDPNGTEPGSEELDTAKWSPVLKVRDIELSGEPRIHQFRGKNGQVWRVGKRTTAETVPQELCVPLADIVDLTDRLDAAGRLTWQAPPGKWTILRLGHTSTGTKNETGGGGRGLESDKFNPDAVRLQFDRWFGEAMRQIGPEVAHRVIKIFHVDSWECGSQNWSGRFAEQFQSRRGYDLRKYLPAYAGIPVESVDTSERFLHDVRQTIAELVTDVFFDELATLSHEHGCRFSAECVAPTMTSEAMRHFGRVDIPMGEFWLRSPTHDKPNDVLDAISAAHVYGRPIVQAEAFTELRLAWDEHPGMLKSLGDRNFAQGINRLVLHVFMHNPWLDRRPGMTLDPIGLFFQRDQTWWDAGCAWMEYLARCQALLQQGQPVVDVAVFAGEEVPNRAVLPEYLTGTLPGLIGAKRIAAERVRLANRGQPTRELPRGVRHAAGITNPLDWIDPLRGYAYDSLNREALLELAEVRDGQIVLPGGANYSLLVLPAPRPLSPDGNRMSPEVADKLQKLIAAGVKVLYCQSPKKPYGLGKETKSLRQLADMLGDRSNPNTIEGPLTADTLDELGIARDVILPDSVDDVAWTHRRADDWDLYFLSNQSADAQSIEVSFHVAGRIPELWDPASGERRFADPWRTEGGRTRVAIPLAPSGSAFVVFRRPTGRKNSTSRPQPDPHAVLPLTGPWQVEFDQAEGGPAAPVELAELTDWTSLPQPEIHYYSGTATYRKEFEFAPEKNSRYWLNLGEVANLAEVTLNGKRCGVAWTEPHRVEITAALAAGTNHLEIAVTNTWANRLIGDQRSATEKPITWTTAPPPPQNAYLLPAGLLGPVTLEHRDGPAR